MMTEGNIEKVYLTNGACKPHSKGGSSNGRRSSSFGNVLPIPGDLRQQTKSVKKLLKPNDVYPRRASWAPRWGRRLSETSDGGEGGLPKSGCQKRRESISVMESSSNGLYHRIVQWMNNRKRSGSGSSIPPQARGREGSLSEHLNHSLNLNQSNSKMARKRLKLLLKNVEKAVRERSGSKSSPSVKRGRQMNTPDSGCHSLASSAAQTPSSERELRIHLHDPAPRACHRISGGHLNVSACTYRWGLPTSLRNMAPSTKPIHRINTSPRNSIHAACFPKSKPMMAQRLKAWSTEHSQSLREELVATWPPSSMQILHTDELDEIDDELDELEACEEELRLLRRDSGSTDDDVSLADYLADWSLNWEDLKFQDMVRKGRNGEVYKGRYHGDVFIQTRHCSNKEELDGFYEEVASLALIRHENIALFMGACTKSPNLAIVTTQPKGPSLNELIVRGVQMPMLSKVNIARQVAQAMGYLHARRIVLGRLSSRSVIVENKVKLCLIDVAMAETKYERGGYGCAPQGFLRYLSPELVKSLEISPPRITFSYTQNSACDVFAFGTLLYELVGEKRPLAGHAPHPLIWLLGNGKIALFQPLKCSQHLQMLIKQCWSYDPDMRPPFSTIVKELQISVSLQKRHSSSEPEKLNRLGLSISRLAWE